MGWSGYSRALYRFRLSSQRRRAVPDPKNWTWGARKLVHLFVDFGPNQLLVAIVVVMTVVVMMMVMVSTYSNDHLRLRRIR
jgi:hypothetical protein